MRISDWSSDVCSSDLAVDLVERSHHRRNARAADHFLERREEILAQFAFGKRRGADIGAALGLAVPGQVLERREDVPRLEHARAPRPLQSLDRGDAHLADEIGVFAERLLDPAPARIARSEEHTSELQSLMRNSYAVFCLKKKKQYENTSTHKQPPSKKLHKQ